MRWESQGGGNKRKGRDEREEWIGNGMGGFGSVVGAFIKDFCRGKERRAFTLFNEEDKQKLWVAQADQEN